MAKFVRPASLQFPHVYHTFKAQNKAGNAEIEYRVEDLPESMYEEALDLLIKDYAHEETVCVGRKIASNAAAMQEIRTIWQHLMKEKFSVACIANDGSNELAGVAVMTVYSKGVLRMAGYKPTQKETEDILELLDYTFKKHDAFRKYNVTDYLSEAAMCTKKEFRNRGVGTELLRARSCMLKDFGLTLTSSALTVIGTQKGATKVGHTDGYSISYAELQKVFPAFDFSKSNTECYKIMDYKI